MNVAAIITTGLASKIKIHNVNNGSSGGMDLVIKEIFKPRSD
jgi:hypothetical protein